MMFNSIIELRSYLHLRFHLLLRFRHHSLLLGQKVDWAAGNLFQSIFLVFY